MFTGYCDKGPGACPDPDCKMYKDRILLRQSCFRKCVWSKLSAWIWLSDAIQKIGIAQYLWQRMVTKVPGLAPVLIEKCARIGLLRQSSSELSEDSMKLHCHNTYIILKARTQKTFQSFDKSILLHWHDKDSFCSLQLLHILYVSRKNPCIPVTQIGIFLLQTLVSRIHSVGN